jgi:hypothetical protein
MQLPRTSFLDALRVADYTLHAVGKAIKNSLASNHCPVSDGICVYRTIDEAELPGSTVKSSQWLGQGLEMKVLFYLGPGLDCFQLPLDETHLSYRDW